MTQTVTKQKKPSLTPPLKWHGGKQYLAQRIINLMPPRCKTPNAPQADDPGWLHYVEPYFGGGAVMLANDPEGISEVVNDLNGELINFWDVLQDPGEFESFHDRMRATPFSKELFEVCNIRRMLEKRQPSMDRVGFARCFYIRCRQSLSGRMDSFAGITRNRTRRGMNEQVSAWLNAVEGLPAVHERLKRVLILNDDALTVIKKEDGPRTLFYLDPPYLHSTRATTGEYAHEMTENDHAQLLNALVSKRFAAGALEGRFLLSGYRSDLYDSYAEKFGWKRHEFELPNNSAGGKSKRRMVECVWTNF